MDQMQQTPGRPTQARSGSAKAEATTPPAAGLPGSEPPSDREGRSPSYLKAAFANPYNLSLLAGSLAAAVLTANPALGVLAGGLEALWLLHAPDSTLLRKLVWDPGFERARASAIEASRREQMDQLEEGPRRRVKALVERQAEIHRLASQNPSIAGDLLRVELGKTERLVSAFLDMSLTCQRYEGYLDRVDADQLARDRKRYGQVANAGPPGDAEAQIARKNAEVTDKRIAKLGEIKQYLQLAKGQLDLIENSFQLLVEQIVTMQSPRELSGQLDELLDGVQAIRETTRDTEQIVGRLEDEA